MNQNKIGVFIAKCRKEKGLTQSQLAEKLGVTDRSISNWENGKCMPDLSLFKPLCEELEISINEFLAGEKIGKENLKDKTDESTKKLVDISSKEIKKVRLKLFLVSSISTMIILFFVVDFACIFLLDRPMFAVKGNVPYMYRGLFYDTYSCPEYSVPQVKMKGTKFSCVESFKYEIITSVEEVCDNVSRTKLYYEEDGRRVYTRCLDSISIKYEDKTVSLKEFIKDNDSLEEAIDKLTLTEVDIMWDGGTKIFKDGGTTEYSSEGLTLIRCNKMLDDGTINKDIYFGTSDMEFKDNYCTNDNRTFIRTYKLENIKHGQEQYSYYLTLSVFQGETDTVLVKDLLEKIEVGKTYEFEFMKIPTSLDIEDRINDIFENTRVISITETKRVGLEQIQEPMY